MSESICWCVRLAFASNEDDETERDYHDEWSMGFRTRPELEQAVVVQKDCRRLSLIALRAYKSTRVLTPGLLTGSHEPTISCDLSIIGQDRTLRPLLSETPKSESLEASTLLDPARPHLYRSTLLYLAQWLRAAPSSSPRLFSATPITDGGRSLGACGRQQMPACKF
jgi:hypothetical protein